MERCEYPLKLTLNKREINRVIIDQHYRIKHSETVDDLKILELIKTLDHRVLPIEEMRGDFQYFVVEPVLLGADPFRLVLVICIFDDYLGVINAFRVDRNKE